MIISSISQRFQFRQTLRTSMSLFLLLVFSLDGIVLKSGVSTANAFGLPKLHRHLKQENNSNQSKPREIKHQTNLTPDPESITPLIAPKTPEPTGFLNPETIKPSDPLPEKIIAPLQSEDPQIVKPRTTEVIEGSSSKKNNEIAVPLKSPSLLPETPTLLSSPPVRPSVPEQKIVIPKNPNPESIKTGFSQAVSVNVEKVTIHIAPLTQEAILMPLNPGWRMTFQGKRENHYLQEFTKTGSAQNHAKNSEEERVSLQALTGLQSKLTASQWTQAYLLQLARSLANPKNLQANVIRNNPNDALFFWTVKNDKKVETQSELQRVLLGKEAIYLIRYTRPSIALTSIEKEQWQAYLQVPFLMTMRVLNEKKYSVDAVERYSIYLTKSLKQQAMKLQLTNQTIDKSKPSPKTTETKQIQVPKTTLKKIELKNTELNKVSVKLTDRSKQEAKKTLENKVPNDPKNSSSSVHTKK